MRITLNFPSGPEQDLVKLASRMELPLEKLVVSLMAVGAQVVNNNPDLEARIKAHWKGGRK